ncbi:MAG: WD40 repeat domain-containing protein [Planctomycetaceae bacterium]|jgi:WD40 repeat protein|nr:WD40 repeat domain-containing protein [Planctomycetaceae bacterium]
MKIHRTLTILLVILTSIQTFSQEKTPVGKLLTGHRGAVDAVAYSGDGKTLVTLGSDKIVIVRDPQTGDEKSRINVGGKNGHRNQITSISINQDGTQIITASNDKTIRRWNAVSGKQELARYTPGKIPATSFIDKQPFILAGFDKGNIVLWNLDEEKQQPKVLRGHTRDILAFAVRGNDTRIAAASEDKLVSIWSLDDDKAKIVFGEHRDKVTAVAFQPRSNRIASGGSDKAIYYWALDGKTGKVIRKFTGHNNEITSLKFSPNEREEVKTLLSTSRDKTLIQWNINTGDIVTRFDKMGTPITAATYTPDFRRVVLLGSDGKAKLFNDDELDLLLPLPPFPKPKPSQYDSLNHLTISKRLQNQSPPPGTVQYSPNGQLLLTSNGTNEAAIRNIETGETYNIKCDSNITSIIFAPDGKTFVTGGENGVFAIWQVADGKRLNRFVTHTVAVSALAFSPRGDYLITSDIAGHVLLWNTATGKNMTSYEEHKTAINSIAIKPDLSQVLTASDKQVGCWKSDGTLIKMLDKHSGTVTSVRFRPDGNVFVSGSRDKTVVIWDAKTLTPTKTIGGFNDTITAIDFTSDSKQMVIGSQEGRAVLFETETWTPKSVLVQLPEKQPPTRKNKRTPPPFPTPVKTLDINPTNNKIVTTTEKETIIWDLVQ